MSEGEGEARERELKLGIPDGASFEALVKAAGGQRKPPALQVNHFFDTADGALRRNSIALRIRMEGQRYALTIKGPDSKAAGDFLTDRVEFESTISNESARKAIDGELEVLSLLDDLEECRGSPLAHLVDRVCAGASPIHVGSFQNERTRVATELAGIPVVLEFDQTSFGADEERFEVELEMDALQPVAPLSEALRQLFASLKVQTHPTTSKLAHFQEVIDRSSKGR